LPISRLGEDGELLGTTVVAERPDCDLELLALGREGRRAVLAWNVRGGSELESAELTPAAPPAPGTDPAPGATAAAGPRRRPDLPHGAVTPIEPRAARGAPGGAARRPRGARGRPVRLPAARRRVVAAAGPAAAHPVVVPRRGRGHGRPPARPPDVHEPGGPRRTHPRRLVLPGSRPRPRRARPLRRAPARRARGTGTPGPAPALPRPPRPGPRRLRPRRPRLLGSRPVLRRRRPGRRPLPRDRRRRRLRGPRRRRGPGRPAAAGRHGPLLRRLPGDGLPGVAPRSLPHRGRRVR